jgi:hypothetical protein
MLDDLKATYKTIELGQGVFEVDGTDCCRESARFDLTDQSIE